MGDDIGHECGFAMLRLLKPPEYYAEKYSTNFYGLNRMYLLMEKQRNRGQDGAGVANVKLDVPPGTKYIHCDKSVAADPIKDLFGRVQKEAADRLKKAPAQYKTQGPDGKESIDPRWIKEHVPFSGECYLAHVRYGTDSENSIDRCHPVTRESNWMTRNLILAGNFNITNNEDLFASLVKIGQHPRELSDTVMLLEKIGHFVDKENNDLYVKYSAAGNDPQTTFSLIAENLNVGRILRRASDNWDGGYCIAGLLGHGDAFVLRDPSGIRPAFYYADDEILVVASEMPLIQSVFTVQEEHVHPIPPGQALILKRSGSWQLEKILEPLPFKQCSFERIYFSRGNDAGVYREREKLGRLMFQHLHDMLAAGGNDLSSTVLSFIPNTAEVAFNGLVKQAQEYLDSEKKALMQELMSGSGSKENIEKRMIDLMNMKVRQEKVVHKDAKVRTFITEDSSREHLTMHAYDVHYGTVRRGLDALVAFDDSIVRGNTLRNAILRTLDRMGPTRIVVLSSCPQIRFPDVYGIDMAKLGDLAAFKAAVGLLRDRGMEGIITETYRLCKQELKKPTGAPIENHVKKIYELFQPQEISDRIAKDVTPFDCNAKIQILYQTVEDLHKALPDHSGDWYFTGDYPTMGGAKVCCRAFTLWMEGSSQRCYGISSAMSCLNMQKPVLVLGSGAKEHSLAWKLSRSSDVSQVYIAPGNGGTGRAPMTNDDMDNAPVDRINLTIDGPDYSDVVRFCREHDVGLAVIGCVHMLAGGLADVLRSNDINVFGPSHAATEIETSKAFAKGFMKRHNIPTVPSETFQGSASLEAALKYVDSSPVDVVVKTSSRIGESSMIAPRPDADWGRQGSFGAAADLKEDAMEGVRDCLERKLHGEAGQEIIIEQRQDGTEICILCLSDGKNVAALPATQDYKRAYDSDAGPNTPGMGAFAPATIVTPALLDQIKAEVMQPTIDGLRSEGKAFVGCLSLEIIITVDGPKLLEFSCCFGDLDTQVILPLIDFDLADVLKSCAQGHLSVNAVHAPANLSSVAVVMASDGYPGAGKIEVGHEISGLERACCVPGVSIFHECTEATVELKTPPAAARRQSALKVMLRNQRSGLVSAPAKSPALTTSGGRVLAVTGVGRGLTEARERAYVAVRSIQFSGAHFRSDIAAVPEPSEQTPKAAKLTTKVNGKKDGITYLSAGVDLQMEDAIRASFLPLVQRTQRPGCDTTQECSMGIGGLCDIGALHFKDPIAVNSTNAVGTKLKVAIAMGHFDTVGTDVVALCANDVVARGAEPVYFMDHYAAPKLDAQQAMQIAKGMADGCSEAKCAFFGSKNAEMPGIFAESGFDLVGFCAGFAERSQVLPKKDLMREGDVIIGLQSSGIHSNGFSLVRSVTRAAGIKFRMAAPFDPTQSLGEVLLTPSRIYTKPVMSLVRAGKLKGAAPIANGGLKRSIPRIMPTHLQAALKADAWALPALFRWMAGKFKIPCDEMAATFNCGIGMALVVAKEDVSDAMRLLKEAHEEPVIIGELLKRSDRDDPFKIEGAESAWLMLPELGVSLPFPEVLSSLQDSHTVSRSRLFVLGGAASSSPLQALMEASEVPAFPAEVVAVASTCSASELMIQAKAAGVQSTVLENFNGTSAEVTEEIDALTLKSRAEVIVVLDDFDAALLTKDFRKNWENKIVIVQASLMPFMGGADPVRVALDNGMCITGCTVYQQTGNTDAIGSILAQESTRINPDDTTASLHARIVKECEAAALPDAVRAITSSESCSSRNKSVAAMVCDPDSSKHPFIPRPRSKSGMADQAGSAPVVAADDAARYGARGVSANKGDVHAAIKNIDKGLFPKAFCKMVPDSLSDDMAQAIVMHADGAGTKSSLAYVYWKATGDLSVWKGIAQDALVMNLDDLLCVGVTDRLLLSSTVGRNKNLIPGEVIGALIKGTSELVSELQEHGIGMVLTGGETADVGDLVRTIIVDSTVIARIPRSDVIDNGRIAAGDVIVGLSSSGQATYETAYNSGIGSNGLTSARHDTFDKSVAEKYPESFDPAVPSHLVYSGKVGLTDLIDTNMAGKIPAGKLLLSPTRTYAPIVKAMLAADGLRQRIHGMVHCSGGAQTKVLHFVDGVHVIKDNLLPTPPVFKLIQQNSGTAWSEMYKVFNMGHRMEIYTDAASAQRIIDISKSFGVDAQVVGRVEAMSAGSKKVTISSEYGCFEYTG
eukprot:TRINITY_DN33680_c0_g1_i1.p1 TRINITY_DN33680_c0_g1~~TRINITY_DN33680_c0_g1_i1.p1  ORF type:complete len:2189 (-),score=547.14 TRINITY_DN33680_c0_g1_i1:559-7125(-)